MMRTAPFRPVLALCRVSNLPTVWMNVLAAALIGGVPPASAQGAASIVLLAFALSCMYCGGMALNDLCDLQYDTVHQPFRPIPAGRVGAAQARAVTGLLFIGGMAALLLAPHPAGVQAGLLLLAVIWAYNYLHKAHTASVLLMAGARLLVYIVVALALTGRVGAPVWLAGATQAAYVLVLTAIARAEVHAPAGRYAWPVVPWLIALMPLVDGVMAALCCGPGWLAAGVACTVMTRYGQRYVRGD
jgi:4-hydroxybenzoate polyprenyltransferase